MFHVNELFFSFQIILHYAYNNSKLLDKNNNKCNGYKYFVNFFVFISIRDKLYKIWSLYLVLRNIVKV